MAFHADPSRREPLSAQADAERLEGGTREYRLIREGRERLGHGALVCPSCSMPVSIAAPVGAGAEIRCGYCDVAARAREYLVRDVYDTPANEVYLVARIG